MDTVAEVGLNSINSIWNQRTEELFVHPSDNHVKHWRVWSRFLWAPTAHEFWHYHINTDHENKSSILLMKRSHVKPEILRSLPKESGFSPAADTWNVVGNLKRIPLAPVLSKREQLKSKLSCEDSFLFPLISRSYPSKTQLRIQYRVKTTSWKVTWLPFLCMMSYPDFVW